MNPRRIHSSLVAAFAATALFVGAGCSPSHAPLAVLDDPGTPGTSGGGASTSDSGTSLDVPASTAANFNCSSAPSTVCACTEIGQAPPVLYVVLDRSGSMTDVIAPSTVDKWTTIRLALFGTSGGVLRLLNDRVQVGLAVFPGFKATSADAECATGVELAPPTVGSSTVYDALTTELVSVPATGGTPTAATLRALTPELTALTGPVYVLLATDGGPNCNPTTPCTIAECSANIDRDQLSNGQICDATINCCDPTYSGDWSNCVDVDATNAAVQVLANAGIKTFVFGIPGSEAYGVFLDQLAQAGGTAIAGAKGSASGSPLYYSASDSTQAGFDTALKAISAAAINTCVISLKAVPETLASTNVLIDGVLLPQDPVNGWSWGTGSQAGEIILNGTTCASVQEGNVSSVQVAAGCPTVVH